jgi:hypothetical protein
MVTSSIFPLEIWLMIFQYLRDEETPHHISRLAQTCKSFHQELNHVIYQPVRLRRVENARHFANTISSRPDLAALVKEVRHSEDVGFSDFAGYSRPFYEALTKLDNLQTLVMRENLPPSDDGHTPQAEVQAVLTDIYYLNEDLHMRESCLEYLETLMMEMEDKGFPLGDASDPFGLGFHPLDDNFSIQCWADGLSYYTYFSQDYLKDLIPALRTCDLPNLRACRKSNLKSQIILELIRILTLNTMRASISLISNLMRQFSPCPICENSASQVLRFGNLD